MAAPTQRQSNWIHIDAIGEGDANKMIIDAIMFSSTGIASAAADPTTLIDNDGNVILELRLAVNQTQSFAFPGGLRTNGCFVGAHNGSTAWVSVWFR